MAATNKDTVYIDIDDEITGIIDKVKNSPASVVALVLPKRATVFQSIVNMKLLKRAADDVKKNIVLITTESGLMPLAGAAGVYVANTLTSKPEIPLGPQGLSDTEELANEDESQPQEITADTDGDTPVGQLAGAAAGGAAAAEAAKAPSDLETIELDDDELPEEESPQGKDFTPPPKPKKDKKLLVPNFNRFRLLLTLGGVLLIALIIFIILAVSVLPKATIDIQTDATNIPVSLSLNLSTTASTLDASSSTVPAKAAQQQKTFSQQVTTTGSKNNGTKATGSVTMTDCVSGLGSPDPVPAGTGLSVNGQTYITQETAMFSQLGTPDRQDQCYKYSANSPIDITAQSGGSSFNVSGVNFSVAGRSDVSASGSASGGTDNIQQVVSASDITNAKNKITTSDSGGVKDALTSQLKGEGYYPVDATFNAGTPTVTQSANVGDPASTVTVTETVTYTMFGAQQASLKSLLDGSIKNQMSGSQSLLNDGLSSATFSVNNTTATAAQVDMSTTAVAGPQLNVASIKQQAAGKKPADVESQLRGNSDVTNVTVHLSPFWVSSVPTKQSKITVNIAKPTKTASQSNSNGQ